MIGRGFNHYRPGFNGGALKDGRTRTAGDIWQKRQKDHSRQDDALPSAYSGHPHSGNSHSDVALSMHSEMMAIRSALSLSSHPSGASARASAWYEKPSDKLPGHGKGENRLRNERIRQYVERVCVAAEGRGGRIEADSSSAESERPRFESTGGFDRVQPSCPQRSEAWVEVESEKESEGE